MAIEHDATYETEDDTANAFLKLWDAEEPSKKEPKEGETEAEEAEDTEANTAANENDSETDDAQDEPSEDAEETEGETEETEATEKKFADDEGTYVKVKVGEEEHEVAVKDLKRLWGQEASLTKKSQEVAERTKAAEATQAKSLAALDVLVKRAQEAANPYRNIQWAALLKDPTIAAEDVQALQDAANAAFENEKFLTGQLDSYVQEVQAQQAAAHAEAAKACLKALNDEQSPTYINGWDQKLYDELRAFAVSTGANKTMVDQLVDPASFKLIHMAMQFHKGSQKVVTQKVNKAPKKIVKASTTSAPASKDTSKAIDRNKAVAKMKKDGGSMKATENAFLAMLGGDE